jgi:predicted TIM-barrel fold metal-dependent hydrolase
VHPTSSPDPAARSLGLPDSLIDFTTDTTRAVAQLHYGNTFARTPNVKYIFSHAGTIPYLATRFSIIEEMNVIPGEEERRTWNVSKGLGSLVGLPECFLAGGVAEARQPIRW